jgi:[NiFe] hydrogenase assembly HybE family chaperone
MISSAPPYPFHCANPAARVVATFAAIARTRMTGLPIANPALVVAVPVMRAHLGEWLGVLVTPWAISLVLLPGGGGEFRALGADETQTWKFASGEYDFIGNDEPGLGPYQSCSLFSPVLEFTDQTSAEATACAALEALDCPAAPATPGAFVDREHRPALDRRAFLRGAFLGGQPGQHSS